MDKESPFKIDQFSTFLFDLDGTLINSAKDIAVAVNHTLQKLGYPTKTEEEIIKHIGYGGKKLMEGVLGTTDQQLIDKAVEIFRSYYFENPCVYTKPYPYVEEVLKKLKDRNKKIAVITNKYEDISRKILETLGLSQYIDTVVGGDTTPYKKPDPYPVKYTLEVLNSSPKEAVMIGDSEADIQAGKGSGVKTALVVFGFGNKELSLQKKPDYIITSYKEMLKD